MILLNFLVLLHIIGDFYTQSNSINGLKKKNFKHLFLHVVIYTVPFISLFFLIEKWHITLIFIVVLFLSHLCIDYLKVKYESNNSSNYKIFLFDQLLHILVLYISWLVLKNYFVGTESITLLLQSIGISINLERVFSVLIVFATILKPTSYLIEMLLPMKKNNNQNNTNNGKINISETNYGAFIGNLERITIVLLGLLNLWSSIALVITAKSIARFKQLEDKDFAQKYLIGTLLSLSITLGLLYIFLV